MLQPSKWLSLYEDFVTNNASSVGQVESALRSLTYIIPGEMNSTSASLCIITYTMILSVAGRYRESEIPSECGQFNAFTMSPEKYLP